MTAFKCFLLNRIWVSCSKQGPKCSAEVFHWVSIRQQPLFCQVALGQCAVWQHSYSYRQYQNNAGTQKSSKTLYRCFCPHTTSEYGTLQPSICSVKFMNAIYVCVCLLCLNRNLVSVGCEWLSTSTCHIHAVLCLARYFAKFHQDRWCFQTAVWKRIFSKAGWEGIWDVVDGWGGCKCWGLELFPDFEPKIASVRVWVLLLLAAQIVLLLLFPKWK